MSTAVFCTDCPSVMNYYSARGFSTEVVKLNEILERDLSEIRKGETLGRQLDMLQVLAALFEECSVPGWDGYDAQPLNKEAYLEARKLILSLPIVSFIPMPEIVPEPSGAIAFEWSKGKRRTFVASVGGNSEIVYAGLYGLNKAHGTEYFGDSLPAVLIENLRKLYL
jgi:hypothetical protein